MSPPEYGTEAYRWWAQGTLDQHEAANEGLTAGIQFARDCLEDLARCHPTWPAHEVAAGVTRIMLAGQPIRTRLRIAWRMLR